MVLIQIILCRLHISGGGIFKSLVMTLVMHRTPFEGDNFAIFKYQVTRLISDYIADLVCNIAGLQLSMLFTWPLLICYVVSSICR